MPPQLRGLPKDDEETRYSKTLAYLLRHGAEKHKLRMRRDGFVRVDDLLAQPNLKTLSFTQLHHLVESNAKKRFTLVYASDPLDAASPSSAQAEEALVIIDPAPVVPPYDAAAGGATGPASVPGPSNAAAGRWYIRAAQGHSLKEVAADQLLEEITSVDEESLGKVGDMVHGTTADRWDIIRDKGLSKMTRNHIHLATSTSSPTIRQRADLFIYLSLATLLKHDPPIPVYLSANGVVLTPGDQDGFVPSALWKTVVRRKKVLERGPIVAETVANPQQVDAVPVSDTAAEEVEPVKADSAKVKKRQGKGGAFKPRFIDEIIWEDGQAVHPPRVIGEVKAA